MKLKLAIFSVFAIVFSTFMTGCCTSSLLGSHSSPNIDTFNPKAVYKSGSQENFALEGIYHNHPKSEAIYIWRGKPGAKAYLILSNDVLVARGLQSSETLLLDDIKNLPRTITSQLIAEKKLPLHYVKIEDLPKNDVYFDLKENPPPKAAVVVTQIVFLPFAIVIDVVTLPFQLLFFWALEHSTGC